MRHPRSRRERDLMEQIFSDKDRAANALSYEVKVGGERVRAIDPRAFTENDAPTAALDFTTPSPLSQFQERAVVEVNLEIEGIPWKDFRGNLRTFGEDADGSGTNLASTSGYYQGGDDAIKFGIDTSFTEQAPSRALYTMLSLFPYRGVRVDPFTGPLFTRAGENRYPPQAPVGGAIDEIEEECQVLVRDSFLDYARVYPAATAGRIVTAGDVREWETGREVAEITYELVNAARFYGVGVLRQEPDGTYASLLGEDSDGRPKVVQVRYPPGVPPPPIGANHYEEISDESTTSTRDARTLAFTLADAFGRGGAYTVQLTLPYVDPRIEDFDVRRVRHTNRETGETLTFLCMVLSQERLYAAPQHVLHCMGLIADRRRG